MSDLKKRIEAPRVDWLDRQQIIRDLEGIEDVIRRQGWLQGMLGRPGGPRCIRGAIYEVIDGYALGCADRVRRTVNAMGFVSETALVRFNDTPGRTKDDVLARVQEAKATFAKGGR